MEESWTSKFIGMKKMQQNNSVTNEFGILLNQDVLTLLQAILEVDGSYLSYADTNANAEDREDVINQLERVFAYELYHQWSMLKDDKYILNGEIDKIWNEKAWYPDMVLHGGQNDPDNNKIVVEIKRECMVRNNKKAIIEDLKKLSKFLMSVEKRDTLKKFRNYENAVFILLKGELCDISKALEDSDSNSLSDINDNIICVTYNDKKELKVSRISGLIS